MLAALSLVPGFPSTHFRLYGSNLTNAPLCSSYDDTPYYHDPRVDGDEVPPKLSEVFRRTVQVSVVVVQ